MLMKMNASAGIPAVCGCVSCQNRHRQWGKMMLHPDTPGHQTLIRNLKALIYFRTSLLLILSPRLIKDSHSSRSEKSIKL